MNGVANVVVAWHFCALTRFGIRQMFLLLEIPEGGKMEKETKKR